MITVIITIIIIIIITSENPQKFCELHQTNIYFLASLFIILSLQLHDRIQWVSMIVVMHSKFSNSSPPFFSSSYSENRRLASILILIILRLFASLYILAGMFPSKLTWANINKGVYVTAMTYK